MRRRLAKGVRMYTGDDFNYAELIAGDDAGLFRRAARHIRCDRAGGRGGAGGACRKTMARLPRHARADGAAVAPYLRAPTRFYKTGIVFMAYLNGHQDHFTMVGGQESARSTLHLAEMFRLADQAGLLARSGDWRSRADAGGAGGARASSAVMRDLSTKDHAGCRSTRRRCASRPISSASSKPARGAASARYRPWRDQVAHVGLERAVAAVRDAGLEAVGLLPRRHVHRRCRASIRRCATTTGAPSTRPQRSARRASCWWSAACRNIPGLDQSHQRIFAAAHAQVTRRASRRCCDYAQRGRHAARDRAAASDVCRRPRLREYDAAGARYLRRARSGADRRDRRRDRHLSYVVGRDVWPQIARVGKDRLLAFHVCDWLVPTKDMLLDRGMMGDGVIDIPAYRRAVEAQGFDGIHRSRDCYPTTGGRGRWTRCLTP